MIPAGLAGTFLSSDVAEFVVVGLACDIATPCHLREVNAQLRRRRLLKFLMEVRLVSNCKMNTWLWPSLLHRLSPGRGECRGDQLRLVVSAAGFMGRSLKFEFTAS